MEIKLVFGDEFWTRLDELVTQAKSRIFIFSAYIGQKDWDRIYKLKPDGVPIATICRSDSGFKPYRDSFLIDKDLYHGKIYVIDNTILMGSQNLYNASKNGEFTVEFEFNDNSASLITYHALLKTCQTVLPDSEPVHESFFQYYGDCCPFCGGEPAEPETIISCPEYGGGYVTESDCEAYGGEGACQFCIPENRVNQGTCYVCDDRGCGFGIQQHQGLLKYHEFVKRDVDGINNAHQYLSLYNYFASRDSVFAYKLFEMMGFTGSVFKTDTERLSWAVNG
ncbi:hypothetical protein PQE20_03795 [Vibrio harveyi]|uniref:hypothetical protein n=1 Tax=Vibrio harveyi TaxID=669 RepID=UPI00234E1A47|nr:hypothetical protein [Vibrio harveyi]WCP81133.1 hypothetical protein PQE20_03795 [Vibrio harveyi]